MIRRRSGTWRATATVERRKASASGAASLDAIRASPARPALALAGATTINKKAPVGAPPTLRFGVSEGKMQSPDAEMRARERDALFEIVNIWIGRAAHSVRSSSRKRGPMITGRCSWVPALATLGRDDGAWVCRDRQSFVRTRAARPALIAQPHRNVERAAAIRECRAVEARRPEHRGGIVGEAVPLLGLAE
jgi:hypothetical protein